MPTTDDTSETTADETPVVAPARRRRIKLMDVVGPTLLFCVFLGFWYWLSYYGMSEHRRFLVPPLHKVLDDGFLNWTNLSIMLKALWLTTQVALWGLGIAILWGMSLAIMMSQARWIEGSVWPYAVALQSFPILALVPLIGVVFDYNFNARVIVCIIISIFPIINNTLFGIQSVESGHHDLLTLHHASRLTRLRKLQLPAASPAIFAGFRISAGLSVVGAIVGDFFFRKGDKGIGILIDQYASRTTTLPRLYAATILAGALGYLVFSAFGLITRRLIGKWYESADLSG
jgi:NitT/TauT family transport system permease protein|tara:strand:- start:28441 stop:29304 length:864 start_codon:yes stop_codon:yes gene_type:complete